MHISDDDFNSGNQSVGSLLQGGHLSTTGSSHPGITYFTTPAQTGLGISHLSISNHKITSHYDRTEYFDYWTIMQLMPFFKTLLADIQAIKENPALGKIFTGDDLVSAMLGERGNDDMSPYEVAKCLS